ncbi:putative ATP-dependent RNA helicase DHX57 [Lycorma delicatula]|uniref:putative ATP-dependent RNA helicase DHX57 n=1 Tax=Lycorma delicatula TaxID=130591 RepID=UPI003F519491
MNSKKTSKWDQGPKLKYQDETLTVVGKKKKSTKTFQPEKPIEFKVELHLLTISEEAKRMILDTLKFINGQEFSTKDLSTYRDRGINLSNRYWVDRGHLIIKSVENYSLKQTNKAPLLAHEKVKKFAMEKLEKYGFHKSHCSEALDVTSGDVGAAYELLMSKYFDIVLPSNNDIYDDNSLTDCTTNKKGLTNTLTQEEIIDERQLELESLKSIYLDSCEERISNQLWVIHLKLPYLIERYLNRTSKKLNLFNINANSDCDSDNKNNSDHLLSSTQQSSKSKDVCKYFLKGNCRFGDRCRHLHPVSNSDKSKYSSSKDAEKEELYNCDIEIRFPVGCRYPYQDAALVSFYSVKSILPSEVCLRLTKHLLQLMNKNVEIDSPCIYTLVDFMENYTEDVLQVAESKECSFIDSSMSLINNGCDSDVISSSDKSDINDHEKDSQISGKYEKNIKESNNLDEAKLCRENDELCRRFRKKQNDFIYKKFLSIRRDLPAWSKMSQLLEMVSNNQVVIISGETGCGKSTQVPQFILDDWLLNRKEGSKSYLNIICTQPRRLSTLAVAGRVAEERNEQVGNTVGYQIRLESSMSANTRLVFCTTGVLLRKFEADPHLATVTHIIVDEVHERSEESDFLLLILKELLPLRPDLKLILMSATLNADLFSEYFNKVPLINIKGRTFPVEELFLEDIMDLTKYVLEENSEFCRYTPGGKGSKNIAFNIDSELSTELETCDVKNESIKISDKIKDENLTLKQVCYRYRENSKQTCKNLYMMDHEKINYELIETILMWLTHGTHDFPKTGSILIFLPGLQEIITLHDRLKDTATFNPMTCKFVLIPLHSTLSNEDQALVFKKQKDGVRKIVISTNIAETSITIDDCVFVIDAGKMKEKRFDSDKNMESLDTVWVSCANAMQRKGRAGRVMPGVCIHLYTSYRMEFHMPARPVPEIHRVPLEQLIIRIKILPVFINRTVDDVFGSMLEPPSAENIFSSLKRLQAVGALDNKHQLTSLGQHLGALPVDVRIGKLILYGAIFCCVDSALTIAACLSYKTPFVSPFRNKEAADAKKKEFAYAKSDQLTVLKAFNAWREKRCKSRIAGNSFASENFMSSHTLTTLVDIKRQFLQLLITIGFVDENCRPSKSSNIKDSGIDKTLELTGQLLNVNGTNDRLLISILCAALYPNIVKVLTPEKYYAMSASGAVPKLPASDEIKFKTKTDGCVNLHPSSINYNVCDYSSPYLVYQEKVRTSRIFIRDCSMVPILPLVLFSGSVLEVQLNNGTFVISLEEGWIMFATESNEVAELLQALQIELFKLLEEKTQDPRLNLLNYPKGKKIITTIIYLVTRG